MASHPRANAVRQASEDIGMALVALQREHGLTDVEMLRAVLAWQDSLLGAMLRAERHPGNADKPADVE